MNDFFARYGHRLRPNSETGCWEWTGATTTSLGYGHFNRGAQHHYAHRAAYESEHGEGSADGLMVRHSCDNPPCCNPEHLLLGTQTDNMRDAKERGRTCRGERHPRPCGNRSLSDDQVRAIRLGLKGGMSLSRLAAAHGVGKSTVSRIRNNKSWGRLA